MPNEFQENMIFEAEVRRVAEAVWGLKPGDCQPEHYPNETAIRELDGIARLREVTHLLMVTVSRKLQKTKDDVNKLAAAERVEARDAKRQGIPISKWFVTKYQLDAEHVKFCRTQNVKVLTFDQFRDRFFDGRGYVQKRRVAAFGSARNLKDGSVNFDENEYVPLPIAEIVPPSLSGRVAVSEADSIKLVEIAAALAEGQLIVLVAPFGSGKSLTLREIFLSMSSEYQKSEQGSVPIAINLREHWGQGFGDEILERHARAIGFTVNRRPN